MGVEDLPDVVQPGMSLIVLLLPVVGTNVANVHCRLSVIPLFSTVNSHHCYDNDGSFADDAIITTFIHRCGC